MGFSSLLKYDYHHHHHGVCKSPSPTSSAPRPASWLLFFAHHHNLLWSWRPPCLVSFSPTFSLSLSLSAFFFGYSKYYHKWTFEFGIFFPFSFLIWCIHQAESGQKLKFLLRLFNYQIFRYFTKGSGILFSLS